MNKLKDILYKNEWFSESEIEKLFTNEIIKCIEECERPSKDNIFNAFDGLKPQDVKVLIIGQDPYPDSKNKKIADGMAFSSQNSKIYPDSLKKIFEEIQDEYENCDFQSSNLACWKNQGVLLLNSSLTYCSSTSIDTSVSIWKPFINQVIDKILPNKPLVVMLWGGKAKRVFGNRNLKQKNVLVLHSSHPKPRYAKYNFFAGCNHFKACNAFLKIYNTDIIEWWKTNNVF